MSMYEDVERGSEEISRALGVLAGTARFERERTKLAQLSVRVAEGVDASVIVTRLSAVSAELRCLRLETGDRQLANDLGLLAHCAAELALTARNLGLNSRRK
jgi:hypothetical protein